MYSNILLSFQFVCDHARLGFEIKHTSEGVVSYDVELIAPNMDTEQPITTRITFLLKIKHSCNAEYCVPASCKSQKYFNIVPPVR